MTNLSISKAWDETLGIITRDGRLIASVALALFVLPGVIFDLSLPDVAAAQFPHPGAWIAVACIAFLLSIAGQLAVIRLALAPQIIVRDAIRHGVTRLLYYLAAAILWTLPFIAVGIAVVAPMLAHPDNPSPTAAVTLLVILPVFVFLSIRFALTATVASAETIGPVAILRRSWELTSGHWWALFGFLFLFGIVLLTVVLSVEFVTGIVARLIFSETGPWTIGGLLVALLSQAASAAAYSTLFVMLARIYLQLAGVGIASVPKSGT